MCIFWFAAAVARSAEGYDVTVVGIDGDSERVLTTQSLKVAKDELTPHWRDEAVAVVQALLTTGIQTEVKRARDKPDDALDVRDLTFRATKIGARNAMPTARRRMRMQTSCSTEHWRRHRTICTRCAPGRRSTYATVSMPGRKTRTNRKRSAPPPWKSILPSTRIRSTCWDRRPSLYQLRLRWEESLAISRCHAGTGSNQRLAIGLKATALLRLQAVQGSPGAGGRVVGAKPK